MEMKPYKIKAEMDVLPNYKSTSVDLRIFFECDGLACENCSADICHLTSDAKHAKRFDLDE